MKKELKYFKINQSFGGDQRWFIRPMMRIGGCGALTACDSLIAMSLNTCHQSLCSMDLEQITKKDYCRFSSKMRPFLYPRAGGIDTTQLYVDGMSKYLVANNITNLTMDQISGTDSIDVGKNAIKSSIQKDLPVPYLMLKHTDKSLDHLAWHWFLVIGYEESPHDFSVICATYGRRHQVSLSRLWDTGYDKKGGLIIYDLQP